MVGDLPPEPEQRLRREELSSEQEAHEFDWDAYEKLIVACLIVPRSLDGLVDYWRANVNMLDWCKKVRPEAYERIVAAFSARKTKLT